MICSDFTYTIFDTEPEAREHARWEPAYRARKEW